METLTRMVADSLARHGLDRPVDPRRLQWSRWFRCDSPHSLLVIPSKPGLFAIAEEVMDLGSDNPHVGADAFVRPVEPTSATFADTLNREGYDFSRVATAAPSSAASAAEVPTRRMLAVLQFSEDDDMAFTLDLMFTKPNPMRSRFVSGRCFLRFVIIEDQSQRRSICAALNQWMLSSAEKASGLPAGFSSFEFDRVGRTLMSANADTNTSPAQATPSTVSKFAKIISEVPAPHLDSGANKNLHCPHPLPSGF
jgi:hypothetical protein